MVSITIFDEVFKDSGWEPKYKDIDLPSGPFSKVMLTFKATSLGDPWDRFYCVMVNGIELHRGISRFGGSITSSEEITSYGSILSGRRRFGAIITTWGPGGWKVTITIDFTPGPAPSYNVQPVFLMEHIGSSEPRVKVLAISTGRPTSLIAHITQHSGEERASRRFKISADGRVIAEGYAGGWIPGQGRVPPYVFNVSPFRASRISLAIEGAGSYWKASMAIIYGAAARTPYMAVGNFTLATILMGLIFWVGMD